MRILGVDPGTATTGFGVIDHANGKYKLVDAGVITTKPDVPMPDRLVVIFDELTQIIASAKPEVVAVELLYFSSNVTTAITVGQSRGIVLLAAAQAKLPIYEYNPMQVKQAITGYGRARKPQIQEMIRILLNLATIPKPDDAADALGIAITHANQTKY